MSLIPFILDLADELHEFNRCLAAGGMDVDDFGFGIYPHELQPQHQPQQHQQHLLQPPSPPHAARRPRALSQLYWLPNIGKGRHHPYYRNKMCCNKATTHLVSDADKESQTPNATNAGSGSGMATSGEKDVSSPNAAGKSAYSVVNKNGFQVSMNVKQFAPNELTVKTIDNCIIVEGQHEDKEDGHGVISRHFIRKYMLPKGYDPNEVLSTLSSDGILTVKAPPPATKTDESIERIVDIQQTGPTQQSVKDSSSKEQTKNTAAAHAAIVVATTPAVTTAAAGATTARNATVEVLQQEQQQLQLQQQELPKSHERNGDANPNEISTEQETEPAEPIASSSSNATSGASNSNVNSNTNSNRKEEPATMLLASNMATPAAIDAIMTAATTSASIDNEEHNEDANMDVDLNVNENVNLKDESSNVMQNEKDTLASVSSATAVNNNTNNNNSTTNTIANNSCDSNSNNITTNNGITDMKPTATTTTPTTTIDNTPSANNLPIADITIVGIETVPIPITVIDGVVAAEDNADGMDGVVADAGIGARVEVIGEVVTDASMTGNADSETIVGVENLVVVTAQAPTTADLVAAADAAILLGKTQCENGNENGQKAVVTTEEITN